MRLNGAHIEVGPQNWQILQRHDGFASIELSGTWQIPQDYKDIMQCVQARIVDENSNRPVINWENCETQFDEGGITGTWKHTLKNIPEGGLYRLETKVFSGDYVWGHRGDMRHHIGVGDIYCIIGQSNSTGYGRDHVNDPPQLGVHLYRPRGEWDLATHPFGESTDTLYPANLEASNPGSCPYLSFGKMLQNALNIPIGLIPAAQGGSPICDWLQEQNGYLYRNMQSYLEAIGNDFTGFLWYQGCTDAQRKPENYLDDFKLLVRNLRKDYGMKPIFTTQLNKVTTNYELPGSNYPRNSFGHIRGIQRNAAHEIENVYVVPSYDLPMSDEIHNSGAANIVIGERLAEVALHEVYGATGYEHCHAPDVNSITKTAANTIAVAFDHCEHLFYLGVPAQMIPFVCEDEKGEIKPVSMGKTDEQTLFVVWERDIVGEATVSMVPSELGATRVLYDQSSFLPPLAFWREKVK